MVPGRPETKTFYRLCLQRAAQDLLAYLCFVSAIAGMPRQRKQVGEMGDIRQRGGRHHYAHIGYYDDEGVHRNLLGPFRPERFQAEADLSAMRAAGVGAEGETAAAAESARRQAVVAAMAAVANQLKKAAAEERAARVEEVSAPSASAAPSDGAASADVVN